VPLLFSSIHIPEKTPGYDDNATSSSVRCPISVLRSSRDRSAQYLRSEKAALCALDDLLVDGLWGVVHDDRALFVIDFGVDAGISDEVDDPFLALVLGEA